MDLHYVQTKSSKNASLCTADCVASMQKIMQIIGVLSKRWKQRISYQNCNKSICIIVLNSQLGPSACMHNKLFSNYLSIRHIPSKLLV